MKKRHSLPSNARITVDSIKETIRFLQNQGEKLKKSIRRENNAFHTIHDPKAYEDLDKIRFSPWDERMRLIPRNCKDCLLYTRKRYKESPISAFDNASPGEEPFSCLGKMQSFYDPSEHAKNCEKFFVSTRTKKIFLIKQYLKNQK